MKVYSPVVSQVVPVAFADLAPWADQLPGQELAGDQARLQLHGRIGPGLAGAVRYSGSLRTAGLLPSMKVELVVSPWSAGRSEIAIHPIANIAQLDSLRSKRFLKAAKAVLPSVVDHLNAELPLEAPAALKLAA
jgi:hypothetical protein